MRKHSIIIYESGKEEREGLVKYLTTHDYEVTQTGDADNVLAMLAQREFDVMLVDLDPEHFQSTDLISKSHRFRPEMRIIASSKEHSVEEVVGVMRAGAVDFMVKPFRPSDFEHRVSEILKPRINYRVMLKADLPDFITRLMGVMEVVGVMQRGNRYVYDRLSRPEELALDYDVTLISPKKYLLPPKEEIWGFTFGDVDSIRVAEDIQPRAIIGVHPDDLSAIELYDRVFAGVNADPYYIQRRENTVVIASDNLNPSPHAFCPSMGTAVAKGGFDLLLTDIGAEYLVTIGTTRGQELLDSHAVTSEARTVDVLAGEAEREKSLKKYTQALNVPLSELSDILERHYFSGYGKTLSESCFSCGSCVMVCPTCFCFDISDEMDLDLKSGRRNRSWDACMFTNFAKVATGENFRNTRAARMRHRMFRKGKYILERYGRTGCVGCGRCGSACLTNIASPVKILNEFRER
jgi:CheY-like chemotaxis protein/NAD-dependent dihydropyrimidine dehydrogenase PreA subunit